MPAEHRGDAFGPYQPPAEFAPEIEAARHVLTEVPGARSPILLFDRDALGAQVALWRRHMELVEPHFAVKTCNAPAVLRHLHSLGTSFDAATAGEIRLLEQLGVPPERVICTHPIRDAEDLRAIARYKPRALVVDNAAELGKLQQHGIPSPAYAPELFVRIELPFGGLSGKFGVEVARIHEKEQGEPRWQIVTGPLRRILEEARAIEQKTGSRYAAIGFSSHVGTNTTKIDKYTILLSVFSYLRSKLAGHGFDVSIFNLGGGYCDPLKAQQQGTTQAAFLRELGELVRRSAEKHPRVRMIAEPGRFMVSNGGAAVIGVMRVDLRQLLAQADGSLQAVPHLKVQMNDGLYGNLLGEHHDEKGWQFIPFRLEGEAEPLSAEFLSAILQGKTCDSWDRLARMRALPRDLRTGDCLLVPHAGAYSIVTATDFNSAPRSQLCLYWRAGGEGALQCQLYDASGREVVAGEDASIPALAPPSAPAHASQVSSLGASSNDLTLSGIVAGHEGELDSDLLRPGALVSDAKWQHVLSLLHKNDLHLQLQELHPVAEKDAEWVLHVTKAGVKPPLALRVGRQPLRRGEDERFLAEAAKLARLADDGRFPRLVEYGILPEGNHPYFLEEFVSGQTLEQFLPGLHLSREKRKNAVDWRAGFHRAVLEHVQSAALALELAHSAGLPHRDIRPANLLLPDNRQLPVKLMNWGLFTALAEGSAPVAQAADIRALGATLFQLVCDGVQLEQAGDAWQQLEALRSEIPPELDTLLRKALRGEPNSSAAELAEELRLFLDPAARSVAQGVR